MTGRRNLKGNGRKMKRQMRQAVDYKHKLTVVEYLIACSSMEETVTHFYTHLTEAKKLNKKSAIRKWRRDIVHIRDMVRTGRGGVKNTRVLGLATVLSTTAEEKIVWWVNSLRKDGVPVTRSMVKYYAKEVALEHGIPTGAFSASTSWLEHFLRRHKFSLRCKTRQGQSTPPDAETARIAFCTYVDTLVKKHNIDEICNADQTGVCYEYLPRQTINASGAKTVWVKCGGRTKDRLTLMLLGDASGTKYPPFLVFKRQDAETAEMREQNNQERHGFGKRLWKELKDLEPKHAVQIYGNTTAWWNNRLSQKFLKFHFNNRPDPNKKILLLWDDFSGHWTPEVKATADKYNVVLAKVPPKYTFVCQPADVSWNKPLKDRLRSAWVDSLQRQLRERDPEKPFKVQPPTRPELVQWIDSAWGLSRLRPLLVVL